MLENKTLAKKIIIITGCNGQLGTIYCEAFIERGAHVIAVDIQSEPNQKISNLISKHNNSLRRIDLLRLISFLTINTFTIDTV